MLIVSGCGSKETYDYGFTVTDQKIDKQSDEAHEGVVKYFLKDQLKKNGDMDAKFVPKKRTEVDKKSLREDGTLLLGYCLNDDGGIIYIPDLIIVIPSIVIDSSCSADVRYTHDYTIQWSLSSGDIEEFDLDGEPFQAS
jgi:hypothetical protein